MRRLLYLAALCMLVVALTANIAFAQDDLDCPDFSSQAEAQQTLRADPSDPNGLDAENDGVACEVTDYPNPERDEVPVQGSVSPSGDLDCEDFANQQEAQAVYNQDTSDPNGLDADNDGLACEDFDYTNGNTPPMTTPPETTTPPVTTPPATTGTTMMEEPMTPGGVQYGQETTEETEGMANLPDTGGASPLLIGAALLMGTGVLGFALLRRRSE